MKASKPASKPKPATTPKKPVVDKKLPHPSPPLGRGGSKAAAIQAGAAKAASGEKTAAIIATLKAIPKGHVTSYGEVAKRAGLPGYARFVCRVLRDLPDRETPWWRVIRSDGRFAMGTETGSGKEQFTRLKAEGLEIKGQRVVGPWW